MNRNQWGQGHRAALFSAGLRLEPDDRHMSAAWGSGVQPICHPCRPDIQTWKPLLPMDLSLTGREGSKFWKLYKDTLMEYILVQTSTKNKSLQKLPPSLPIWVGGSSSRAFIPCHSTNELGDI